MFFGIFASDEPAPIESWLDEIHRIRHEISDRFGGDIAAITADAARRQAASNRPVWQRKAANPVRSAEKLSTIYEQK